MEKLKTKISDDINFDQVRLLEISCREKKDILEGTIRTLQSFHWMKSAIDNECAIALLARAKVIYREAMKAIYIEAMKEIGDTVDEETK